MGTEVCKALRKDSRTARIPVMMVTAKSDEIDRVVGFEAGADDYIAKPFYLVERRGRIISRDRLLQNVWSYNEVGDTRTVDTHITRLRSKLGPPGDQVKTVRGFGCKIEENWGISCSLSQMPYLLSGKRKTGGSHRRTRCEPPVFKIKSWRIIQPSLPDTECCCRVV